MTKTRAAPWSCHRCSALLRKKLPFSDADLERLLRSIAEISRSGWWTAVSPAGILRALEERIESSGLSATLRAALVDLAARLREHRYYGEPRDIFKRVEGLLEAGHKQAAHFELTTGEAWTRYLGQTLAALDATSRVAWDGFLSHCAAAKSAKPTQKWLQQARALLPTVGESAFVATLLATLAEVGKPGKPAVSYLLGNPVDSDPTIVHETHSDLLRGLVWCASLVPRDEVITAIGDAADVCFKKIPGVGPRAPKIGNACLVALSAVSSTAAVAQLSRLKTKSKHVSIQKQLGKALDIAAEKTGLSAQELEEVAVPTCGLTGVGELRQQLGEFTACMTFADGSRPALSWIRPDCKEQATVPAAVKEQFPSELKGLKLAEKELGRLLPAQRDRLEQVFLQQRTWPLGDFRSRFLDHPLVGVVARRLIWCFTAGDRTLAGTWHEGQLVDVSGRGLDGLTDATRVSLWHPHAVTADGVRVWRDWLETHQVRQPFKQAHREIYLLTDAERRTEVYSNRFASHILKQHQFAALCQQRGWRYHLQGEWDSANTPTLELPVCGLRAVLWVVAVRREGPLLERGDISHHGIYLYVIADQVRFYRTGEEIPLPLTEVPSLVFSEVMRDVDLFVGVSSVGSDPTWRENELYAHYATYWENFSFGELFQSAETRKEVLQRIVPRLKIADRCSFSDRFLIVRGDLRTYKIHLGSGNILMSPNDQYLCIVPGRGAAKDATGKVYLPFDGDALLSVIISKALLLAEDRKIKDPTITRQIQPQASR